MKALFLFTLLIQMTEVYAEICPPYERTLPDNWVEYNDTVDIWQCHNLASNITECNDKDSKWLNITINYDGTEKIIQIYQNNTWKEATNSCE